MIIQKYLDELTYEVVGSAIEVHKIMGRGLLESVYHQCLKEELIQRKINFSTEFKVLVSDFKIDIPTYLGIKVADEVTIKTRMNLNLAKQ